MSLGKFLACALLLCVAGSCAAAAPADALPAEGEILAPPTLALVQEPPATQAFMRAPQPDDFASAVSRSGGYELLLPKVFGSDPLAGLPALADAMLVRTAADNLLCAAVLLDVEDTTSYAAREDLPAYEGKKILLRWQQGEDFLWECSLSRHADYFGEKILLEARHAQGSRTWQLLYVLPRARLAEYLPQALQSLHSFKLRPDTQKK